MKGAEAQNYVIQIGAEAQNIVIIRKGSTELIQKAVEEEN